MVKGELQETKNTHEAVKNIICWQEMKREMYPSLLNVL
jgi:hypothetical protein